MALHDVAEIAPAQRIVVRPWCNLYIHIIGVNLGIFMVFRGTVSIDAAPTGLGFLLENAATQIPSLRDSRGF